MRVINESYNKRVHIARKFDKQYKIYIDLSRSKNLDSTSPQVYQAVYKASLSSQSIDKASLSNVNKNGAAIYDPYLWEFVRNPEYKYTHRYWDSI